MTRRTKPVVVLGMHRSGTSVIAHCLIKLGVNMGENLLKPDIGNPLGYFEDKDFLSLNKAIIKMAGGEWNLPVSKKYLYQIHKKFQFEIHDLLQERIKNNRNGYWGWKDPRNCLTAWLYHQQLNQYRPKYIFIVRNRQDVLKSLLKRNQDVVNWAKLAKHYSDHVSSFIKGDNPKIHIINYEDLVLSKEKAFSVLVGVSRFLGMKPTNKQIWKSVSVVQVKGI